MAYSKQGSVATYNYLINKIIDGVEFTNVDEALHLCNIIDEIPQQVIAASHDKIMQLMSMCFDYVQDHFDKLNHADQYMIVLSFLFNWDSMNAHHYTNDHDDSVHQFLEQRMAFLNKKMDKLGSQCRNVIN